MSPKMSQTNLCNLCTIVLLIVLGYVHKSAELEFDSLLGDGDDQRWTRLVSTVNSQLKSKPTTRSPPLINTQTDQFNPALFNWLQSYSELGTRQVGKRLSTTQSRKPRAEGEKIDSMLNILKKMEECMRLNEGLRFRKRSTRSIGWNSDEPEQQAELVNGRPSVLHGEGFRSFAKRHSQQQLRSLKNMCQI